MRSVPGAHFLFDWTINEYSQPVPLAEWYPGNHVVDIIGIDAYDAGIYDAALTPAQRWTALYNQPDGLAAVAAFAAAHHKPLSVPEWGLVAAGSAGGANNDPTYVRGIAQFVHRHDVVYQSYFYQPNTPGLVCLTQAASSLAVYKAEFGRGVVLPAGDRLRHARP
jgi:beta-mannanase